MIAACSDEPRSNSVDNSKVKPNAMSATLLPVDLRQANVVTLTDRNFKRINLTISAEGGTIDDQIATALVVAEKLANIQNDMIEIVIERTDLDSISIYPEFKQVVQVSYAPKLERAPGYSKTVQVRRAERLFTITEVQFVYEYNKTLRNLLDSGMEQNKADRIAGEKISEKYGLPTDWKMPMNILNDSNVRRDDYFVNADSAALDSIYAIVGCIGEQSNVTIKKCS